MKKLNKNKIGDILALTPMQEGLLFHYLHDPGSDYYLEQLSLRIFGEIDLQLFENAWNTVSQTNEMLRAVFRWEKLEKPSQIILKEHKCSVIFHDLSDNGVSQMNPALEEIKKKDRGQAFDLHDVPFRVILCKLSEKRYEMIVCNHHILYDGWSNGILLKEFFKVYHALSEGKQSFELPEKSSFKEYVRWLQTRDKNKQEQFWRNCLAGFETPTELPIKRKKGETKGSGEYSFILGENLAGKAEAFVKNNRATLAAVFYTAWAILLQKYCGRDDVLFGTTVSGRSADVKGIGNMVGLFINTIPLRTETTPTEKIGDLVFRVDRLLREREEFETTPLVDIGSYSTVGRGQSLFDTIVVIENYPLDDIVRRDVARNVSTVQSYSIIESTHYDLTVGIIPFNEIEIKFSYKRELFEKELIENVARHFNGIIQAMMENPEMAISHLEIISIEEKNRILNEFNNTTTEYPVNKTIYQLFEEQASKTPDHMALVGADSQISPITLSYNELNKHSDHLAGMLIEKGVLACNVVGIMMERSIDLIIGILGILKAGCAYLPINPGNPQERIDYMLKDSGAVILLTDHKRDIIVNCQLLIVNCKLETPRFMQTPLHHSSFIIHHSNQLAYIIYTSGSTGMPKGVPITHANLSPLLHWGYKRLGIDTSDRTIQNLSYYFDWSVWEIFITLTTGASLYMVPEEVLMNPAACIPFIIENKITVFHVTPTQYRYFVHAGRKLDTLKYLFLGAEKLTVELLRRGFESVGENCRVFNMYGPTEAAIISAVLEVVRGEENKFADLSSVPIGGPLGNGSLLVLDKDLNLSPVNIPGELYIGGDGVAMGYLNNPELTAERFNRSYKSYGTYIFYKTGDWARWLNNGAIEFLGRIDQQVKIRGFRIEPGEIESRLAKHTAVKEAVVTIRPGGSEKEDNYLCAYIVPHSAGAVPVAQLREFLSRTMPDYMIPAHFVMLEKIPLNPNGKLDQRALPEPEILSEEEQVMPRNETEVKLAEIWSGILGIDRNKIGIDANFFHLGGHSLKLTQLSVRVHRELGISIPLSELFKLPTIRTQSDFIGQSGKVEKDGDNRYISIQPMPQREYYDLSYAQRRLWIICQFEEDSIAYNEVGGLTIKGKFAPEAFDRAIKVMVQRHEIFRTVFVTIDGEPKQKILPEVDPALQQEDLRRLKGAELEAAAAEIIKKTANKAFNLEKGPLAIFKLLRLEDERYFLLVNIHHIINDGWSVGVIKHELNILYDFFNKNRSANEEIPLAPVTVQYKDYTLWHNSLIAGGYFDRYRGYWLEKLKDKPTGIELPLDHPRGAVQTFNGGRVYYRLEAGETTALRALSGSENTTIFMKLMALLGILLHKYSGEKDIILGSPIANRKQPELHHMIGFLVNTLVYRIPVEPGESFQQLLAKVKEETLACYENQDYPFDTLVESLGLARDMSRSPLFNVLIAFGDADTRGEDIRFDWADVEFHDQVEGFNPSVFDLVLFFNEKGIRLDCEIMYNSDLFERNSIERMAANFITLVKHVLGNSEKAILELDYIDQEEYKTIVHRFNGHREEFLPLTIQELVEQQVEKSLDGVAAVSPEGWAITYDEINRRANRLAHYLRKKYHIEPGKVIGICIERSLEMIIAVFGVVKSGAAYLSFDPNYPKDRVRHMIEDSRTGLVIVDQSRPDLFDMNEEKEREQAPLDIHQHWSAIGRESDENPNIENDLSDAVYVIYTSGSTGSPNGAMLSHALLSNLIQWQIKDTVIDCSLRCLQFTSINFCVSFQEIFTTFSAGGEVHLIGDIERQDIDYLMEFLARRKIGNLYLPFSYLNFLFNLSGEVAAENYLRHIITAGEQLKITGGLKQFLEQNPHVKLHNHYGSSEMHVVTSYTLDAATASLMPVPPAGKPIANTRIYILDEYERPVPMGVWGELFVDGGDQVLGYIHNPVLTDKKLVWHPLFSPLSGRRLYRSGDVGRWLEDGNIELKGRKDFQVKIRGFRVELSEIESKILALDKVKDCVVVVKENAPAEKTLVAYIVGHDLDIVEIKRHLGSYLPRYMIPKFMALESLPLMPNGKVDREKLPELPTENEMMKIIAARPAPDLTPLRGQIRDFDGLPMPDRSLVNYDKYGKNIGLAMVRHTICLQASRGCPYNCLYCHKIWPKKHVFRSAENIFREVELYYNMGVRRFVFVDDIFNLDVKNSTRFFEMVIKKGLNAHFFFPNGLRSDILTEEYIDLMAAGGTRGVGMALESASPRIQRLLKKNLDLDKLRENAEYLCKKHPQIVLELFLMHGFPTETEEEAILTLEFLKALHWIDFPYLHILKIFPNTDMAAMAMENGVTAEAIARSAGLAFHELPETLPFAKSFTLKRQAEFLGDYFLLKERLLDRLPHQMRVLTPEELVEKYNSYLPVEIKTVEDVLEFAGIEKGLLIKPDEKEAMSDEKVRAIDLDAKIHAHFGPSESEPDALRVLLLDLSQYFSAGKKILYDGVEPPLGLMYLLTYLKRELGSKVNGKIAKSRVDFDSFEELKALLEDFQPRVIGIRTLTYYSRFFHEAVGSIRQWGFAGPIIAGGPYATSDYTAILKDPHVDVVVLSEGELTFAELVSKIIANNNQLPGEDELKEIAGLAYVPGNRAVFKGSYCGEFTLSEWGVGVSPDVQAAAAAAAPGVGQKDRFEDEIEEKLAGIWAELLDVDKSVMGREDNFFELGGHSLKATTMMTRIQKEFNVRVKLIDIFKAPFISGVARLIRSALAGMAEEVGAMEGGARILPVEKKDYYVVSSTQKRMYILQRMETSSSVYNMPRIMILEGEINRERLETTVRQLIRRHESFRTSFEVVGGEPVQRVHDHVEFEIEYNDLDAKDREALMLGGPIIKSFIRSFDLTKAPLLRVGLLRLAEGRYLLMVDMHHIISDGVSIEILIKDFMALYRGEQLPAVELQYKDYSEWRQGEAVIEALRQQETYWAREFQGEIPVLNMPLDYVRPKIQDFAGRSLHFQLEEQAARALKAFALEEGATLYMVMLTIYSILLAKISSQEDIIIGGPVAGRRHGGLQRIIGMFVNTMAMQIHPAGDKNIREFLREIKIKALNAFANQDYPYEELVEKVTVNRDPGRNPLFDTMFALQNLDIPEIEMPGLKLKPYPYEQELSKFDLSLQCFESGDAGSGLTFIFEYCTRLFRAETIEKFSDYFKRIISGVIKNPGAIISSLEIISAEEKDRLLYDFNRTEAAYPQHKTNHELFEEQVERTPDHVVLVGDAGPVNLTYRHLNEKAGALACVLIEKGTAADSVVGLMAEPGIYLMIGIMGILKAGGAYLPIDPNIPAARVEYMLKDSGAKILIIGNLPPAARNLFEKRFLDFQKLLINEKFFGGARGAILQKSPPVNVNLAYVIYTSGSTGRPKGVAVEHRQLVNFVYHMYNRYNGTVDSNDRCLGVTNIMFDVSVWEFFLPLLFGARLVLAAERKRFDVPALVQAIVREEITMIYLPPGLLKEVNSQLAGQPGRVRLNKMLVGVEPIRDEALESYVRLNPRMRIINGYGPTETTICATSVNYVSHEPEGEIVPIGLPLSNNQVVLLDAAGHVVPQGIPGEICISGGGVSRGYLNNPEMTAEKYVAHPYFKGKRMYRTGDLGRILPGFKGSETQGAYMIKFQGRVDHQVKIRGYRIEPGEIEKRLLKHRQIKEALVLTLGDEKGGKYLCAYFVPGDTAMEAREVREYLAGDLPEYMIPSYFVRLDKIPLTPNGKVDRNALPAPETGIDRENYVAPRDAVEMKLVGLWADVLKIDKDIIGIDANFFELGGHSLRANVLVTRIEKEFQVKIPLAEVFVTPFVRGLAERIGSTVKEQSHPVEIAEKKEYYPVSSAQERLYVLRRMDARGIVYNMPSMLIVEGEIDKEKLENIFYRLLKRHESLRTSFLMLESRLVQRVHDTVAFEIEYYNSATDERGQTRTLIKVFGSPETFFQKGFWPPEAIMESFIQPFDLSQAPLLRVGLAEVEERRHILIVDMHHIISDGVSLDIFTREFVALYAGMELPPLKIQYKDYCEWQAWVTRGQDMETHRQYWLNRFQGKIPALNLPTDFARPAAPTFEGGLEQFEINAAVTKALNQLALEEGVTLYMVLAAALVILLSRITGQEDIVIGTVSAGRDHPDLQGIVGMFVNTLALRSYPSGGKTFREFLQEMKSCVLESFAHQDYPFEDLVEQLNGPGNTRQNSLFDVMFSLNNMELEIPKIPGLKLTPYKYDQGSAKFDLTIMVFTGESLVVNIEYRSKLFKKERIKWFAGYFEDIVAVVLENKETRLEQISIAHGLLAAKEIELEKTFNF